MKTEVIPVETIELDCPPGEPRPWDLIAGVIEGTGLTLPAERPAAWFGLVVWEFPCDRERWVNEIQPIIKPRHTIPFERVEIVTHWIKDPIQTT